MRKPSAICPVCGAILSAIDVIREDCSRCWERQYCQRMETRALAAEAALAEWQGKYQSLLADFDNQEAARDADNARLRRLLKDLVFARHRVIPRRDKRYCEASLDTSLDTCKFCAPYYAALAEPSAE